jgi:hypothetical protein
MRNSTHRLVGLLAFLLWALPTSEAAAQRFRKFQEGPARLFAGIDGELAVPQDEFARYVGNGGGVGGHFLVQLDDAGIFGLRADAGFVIYGHETKRVPFSSTVGGRVNVDVSTSNNIVFFGVGPQLMMPNGKLRPYLTGSVGLAYFYTRSSVDGVDGGTIAETKNFSDATFAWTGAAGLYIPVKRGLRPISIDVGARYHGNGNASYLREGSIHDNPDNTITITPLHSQTHLLAYHVGVTFGF